METITRDQFDNLQIGNQLKSECYSLTVEAKFLNTIIAVDNNDGIAGVYSFDNLVRGEYSIISNLKLLEKAIREYAIGTNIKSIYDGNIYICNTKPFFYSSIGHIYVKDENGAFRCIYDKTKNKWAEIINQNIMTDSELLEKAIRDYPIGTEIKSIYDGYIHICNTKPFIMTCPGYIYVNDENKRLRCIYSKTENKWAEIINQNIMTDQEFKDLKVGDFISIHEIIHKYKEFLIVKCDDGHDLFDLVKINKLKLTPETFLGLKIGNYDCVPVEIDGNTLAYLIRVRDGDINISLSRDEYRFNHIPQSIRIL